MQQIHIENPCQEKWNKMIPLADGRFCESCKTPVIDFTNKTEQEILKYFARNDEKHICGKYRAEHVSTPRSNRFKWILIGLTMVFGSSFISSCRRHVQGRMKFTVQTNMLKQENSKSNPVNTNER